MAFEQQNRLLSLSTPLGKDAFILTRFSGSEGITRESRFTLSALSENKQLSALDLIGKAVNFDIELLDGTYRVFNGIVESIAAEGIVNKDYRRYEFTVVSRLSLLKKKTDTRIFQHQSLLDTIKAVLDEHHIEHRSLLNNSYPTQLYCTQYNETDFDFVHRLLKEAGISYRLEHETGKHTLVLFDHTGGYVANPEAEHEYVDGTSGKADYHGWSKRLQFPSGRTAQRSFNFLDPYNPVAHQQDTLLPIAQAVGYERYQYPALYSDTSPANQESERSIESQENEYSRVSVNSHCRTLAPGQTFGFNRHLIDEEVGPEHAIVQIHYTAQDDTYLNQPGATQELTCQVNCIPKESFYRDTRDYPRPSVKGVQTAIVSGPNGEEIYTDEHGRLKVQFHWDRQGKRDHDSSCWIRVNQRIAGPGWGDQHLPRIGQEALIQFEDNDINKPIILGTLYNGKNHPAYSLPANKTQSGIKTRSSKGATPDQFNEIRFEDKKDNEELYIQAQKDHNMLVKHDQSRAIGADQYVSVGNNRSEIIKKSRQTVIAEGSDKLQVEQEINIQSVKAGIILEADKFIEFRTGKSTITLQSNGKIIIKAVQVDIDGTKGVNLNGGQSPGSKRLTPNKAKGIFTTPKEGGAAIPKIKVTPVKMMTVTKVDVNAKSRAVMPKFIKASSANGLMKTAVPRPDGSFEINQAQYEKLKELSDDNRRPEYYMELYNLTGTPLFAEMAQISSNSGFLGGVAWRANDIIVKARPGIYPSLGYPDDKRISDFSKIIFDGNFEDIKPMATDMLGEQKYLIQNELGVARRAYERWVEENAGFADIAPPLLRYGQQIGMEGNTEELGKLLDKLGATGNLEGFDDLQLSDEIQDVIKNADIESMADVYRELKDNGVADIEELMKYGTEYPAVATAGQSIVEELVANEFGILPKKGFYEDDFIEEHGGIDNVDTEYSRDGKFKTLSADKNSLSSEYEREYGNITTHPSKHVIVLPVSD